jgi:hypothetical protein
VWIVEHCPHQTQIILHIRTIGVHDLTLPGRDWKPTEYSDFLDLFRRPSTRKMEGCGMVLKETTKMAEVPNGIDYFVINSLTIHRCNLRRRIHIIQHFRRAE